MTKDEMRALLLDDEQMALMSELLTNEPELRRSIFRALGHITTERKAKASAANGRQAKSEEARAKMREGWARRREAKAAIAASVTQRGSRDLDVVDEYQRNAVCSFKIASDVWGDLSNFASGFPLQVQGVDIPTVQQLYVTQTVPDHPDIQQEILSMQKPWYAEGRAVRLGRTALWRQDWEDVYIEIMQLCLRAKLEQHYTRFSARLLETGNRDIVQEIHGMWFIHDTLYYDPRWGTRREHSRSNVLRGYNRIGKLLMELRDEIRSRETDTWQQELRAPVPGMRLLGRSLDDHT